jgi:hypothetical protein
MGFSRPSRSGRAWAPSIAAPGRFRELPREAALALTGLVSAANATSLGLLIHLLLHHHESNGRGLVVAGALIWLTNMLIFALWYWELDRGGPARRASGRDRAPDFLFHSSTTTRFSRVAGPPGSWTTCTCRS